jgi:hypothetical protein
LSEVIICLDIKTNLIFKKPETLKNLAWLTIRREVMLFGRDKYQKIADRFFPSLFANKS